MRLRLVGGVVLLGAAVCPPASRAAGMFLTAHMIRHVMLVQLVPLLVLTGLPRAMWIRGPSGSAGHTIACWAAGVGAMTIWYTPPLFAWMMRTPAHRAAIEVSLVVAGLLFWSPVFSPSRSARLQPGPAIAYMFAACLASTIAGASIAFAGPGLFPDHVMSLLDQQVAGLVMWVPCCAVYVAAVMATLADWYGGADDDQRVARTET